MNRIHHIGRLVRIGTGLVAALVAAVAVAPDALATVAPPPGPVSRFVQIAPPLHHTHAAVTGGLTGWQVALIAVGAAILAAAVAVLVDRALVARRHLTATPA
jgi:hypothetical protein